LQGGILLAADEGLAEGLATEVVGVRGCALALPIVAHEGWERLGVVGDVWSVAGQTLAVEGESIRIAGVGACLSISANLRAGVLLRATPTETEIGGDAGGSDAAARGEVLRGGNPGNGGHDES